MRSLMCLFLVVVSACLLRLSAAPEETTHQPAPAVPVVKVEVQPEIDQHLAEPQKKTIAELAKANSLPARCKLPLRMKAVADPWAGLIDVEQFGLRLSAEAAAGPAKLADLLDDLGAALGKPRPDATGRSGRSGRPGRPQAPGIPRANLLTLEDHAKHTVAILDKAKELRDAAVAKLSPQDREFMFTWAPRLVQRFGPQTSLTEQARPLLENDRRFCTLASEQYDWAKWIASAKTLAALAEPRYLADLRRVLEAAAPIQKTVPGVTGNLLFKKDTPHGLIVFGGKGANTYRLNQPVALLVDLGGNDRYEGLVASSFDASRANSVLIDFAGDDTYAGDELGVATGRLGVGLLVDLDGKDTYELKAGSGGAGIGGIGILHDRAGDDTYIGSRISQGAGLGGIGLLLEGGGNDVHTSHGYAIGLGGPSGIGAVIDVAGDDSYQCGRHYASGYNPSDAPNAKPGDPNFQYDSFGLAIGIGRRIYPFSEEGHTFNLAGGVGLVLDLAGQDKYDSSNFSQACGYFFGIGLKLDLAGDDLHAAARYGQASGAHYGMGLFVDYAGQDAYASVGPTYNCGCSWDRSVFLFVDAAGNDSYDLTRSHGLGIGDIGSWGVFADLAGADRYRAASAYGRTSRDGLACFLDRAGLDEYTGFAASVPHPPGNDRRFGDGAGGRFVDR